MGYLRSRVAYLQGLVEGLALEDESNEGRVLNEMIEVLGELVETVEEVDDKVETLAEHLNDMDDDLTELETDFYQADTAGDRGAVFLADGAEPDGEVDVLCCPDCGQPLAAEAGETGRRDALNVICPGCGTLLLAPGEEIEEARAHQ